MYDYEKICPQCGARIDKDAQFCAKCGAKQDEQTFDREDNTNYNRRYNSTNNQEYKQVSGTNPRWLATLLLCIFLGYLGIHRFYNHRIGTGILMLITCGLGGIWTIIDLVMIIVGKFKDQYGNYIKMT